MSIHPALAERFSLLDGITSFDQAMADPVLEGRLHRFLQYPEATAPPRVPTREASAPGPHGPVPIRIYEPPVDEDSVGSTNGRPCMVWHRGGAFIIGDLDMPEAHRVSREIACRASAVVVSVDYRLAVDGVHYPVPLDDCVAVLRWVRDGVDRLGVDPGRIAVGGASAGANLAAGATLRVRDANYVGGPVSATTGYAMPALAELDGMCPTVVVNAEYDDLRPSGQAFAAALAVAGVDVQQVLAPHLLHSFLNLPPEIEPVADDLDLMAHTVSGVKSTVHSPVPVR